MSKKKVREPRGEVIPDTVAPMPVRFTRTEALTEQMRAFIRDEVSRAAGAREFETFDEANDFEIEDDYNPSSPHEQSIEEEFDGRSFKEFIRDEVVPFINGNKERVARKEKAVKTGSARPAGRVEEGGREDTVDGEGVGGGERDVGGDG